MCVEARIDSGRAYTAVNTTVNMFPKLNHTVISEDQSSTLSIFRNKKP